MTAFVMNCWYMAGWSRELDETGGFSRQILDQGRFFWRKTDGTVVAMRDKCPHRFAPLSMGKRCDNTIVCGYHGLEFDENGKCVRNPFSDRIPANAVVQTYPAIEQDGIIWFWPGDPGKADPATIPDFSFIPDTENSHTISGYTLMKANYEYGTDNLLDLSHIEFVHTGSFAGQGVIFRGNHKVEVDGDTLHSNWWMPGINPPSMAPHLPPDMLVDHWLDMRWNAPATMHLTVGVCPTGEPRDKGFEVPQAHILTPANRDETHYFWASTRTNDIDSKEMDEQLTRLFTQAFDDEDKPMIEAAYHNMDTGDFSEEKPAHIGVDSAGVRARRMIQAMIKEENTQPKAAASG